MKTKTVTPPLATTDQKVSTFRRRMYQVDKEQFPADAYKFPGWADGVAWDVLGWELVDGPDTEWDGIYQPTGDILAVMVGDDRVFSFGPDEATPTENYCGGCGQIGCGHQRKGE